MGVAVGSVLLSLAIYAALWGAPLALGLVAGMYVHELGHVLALRSLGLPASAPMFIPLVGAAVRMRQPPRDPSHVVRVALAGPVAGFAFAGACLLGYALTGQPVLLTLTLLHVAFNLFDLLPFGPLDGGRAWRALRAAS